jgi:multiple sugar transport system substrate-binding protein
MKTKLLALAAVVTALGMIFAACAPATPVVIEKEVIKEVPVEKQVIVEKEVLKEVPVEKVVEKEVIKEVEVEKEVLVTAAPSPKEPVHVVWLVRTQPPENRWEQEIVKPAFEARHPDIKLDIVIVDQDDIPIKLEGMIAAGEPLDVWCSSWGAGGPPQVGHLMMDLTPFVERDEYDMADFVPEIVQIFVRGGKLLGLPLLSVPTFVYYNMDIFDEAGVPYPPLDWDDDEWTWDAAVELAHKLTHDYGDPVNGQYGLWTQDRIEDFGYIWGKNVFPEEVFDTGFTDEVYLEDPDIERAFQLRHDLMYKEQVMPEAGIMDALSQLGGAFESGKIGMLLGGGWGHWVYRGIEEEEDGFCWGAAPVPKGEPGIFQLNEIYSDPWVITEGTPNADAAWTFLKYVTSIDASRAYMQATGTPPTRRSLLEEYFDLYPCMGPEKMKKVYMGGVEHGIEQMFQWVKGYPELGSTFSNLMADLWLDPDATAAEVLPGVDAELEALLQRIRAEYE